MNIVKWKIDAGQFTPTAAIERVECTRETASSVWVLEDTRGWFDKKEGKPPQFVARRRNKGGSYYDTWEAAHAALLADAERRLESMRAQLARVQGHHGNVKGLKKPEGA